MLMVPLRDLLTSQRPANPCTPRLIGRPAQSLTEATAGTRTVKYVRPARLTLNDAVLAPAART